MEKEKFVSTKLNILGEEVNVILAPSDYLSELSDAFAMFDPDSNEIVFNEDEFESLSEKEYKRVYRHEIIHAFRILAGGRDADCFPEGEEMIVEFFAQMSPKMFDIFNDLDIL